MSGNAGGELFAGNSGLLTGPLGVVKVGFNGYDLGKTTADAVLSLDQDIKDILYQQEGTKAGDHVRTGMEFMLKATFGEIKTGLLSQILSGFSSVNTDPNDDNGELGRCLYESMRDTEAKALRVVAVDCNGIPSAEDKDTLNFYEAIPIIDGDLINWGADSQRNLAVTFKIKYHIFDTGESVAKAGSFGYWGDPTALDVPAVTWPDVSAPYVKTAAVTSATEAVVTFNEDIALVGGVTLTERFAFFVDDVLKVPTAAVIGTDPDDDKITLTFAAATFTSGDVVTMSLSADSVENQATTPVSNEKLTDFNVTNSL